MRQKEVREREGEGGKEPPDPEQHAVSPIIGPAPHNVPVPYTEEQNASRSLRQSPPRDATGAAFRDIWVTLFFEERHGF